MLFGPLPPTPCADLLVSALYPLLLEVSSGAILLLLYLKRKVEEKWHGDEGAQLWEGAGNFYNLPCLFPGDTDPLTLLGMPLLQSEETYRLFTGVNWLTKPCEGISPK